MNIIVLSCSNSMKLNSVKLFLDQCCMIYGFNTKKHDFSLFHCITECIAWDHKTSSFIKHGRCNKNLNQCKKNIFLALHNEGNTSALLQL